MVIKGELKMNWKNSEQSSGQSNCRSQGLSRLFTIGAMMMILGLSAQTSYAEHPSCSRGDIYTGGSGDVPTPFGNVNQKYELADGEIYALPGKFVAVPPAGSASILSTLYFAVETESYSWLTNKTRYAFRYYPVEFNSNSDFRNSYVNGKFLCRAHGRIMQVNNMNVYVVYLQPLY
jgi:hypothetical protein